jgi:CBS domain containing-hemolysin-like protein
MLSLSALDLEIIKRTGSEVERRRAASLVPLISRHHLLLVTLLLLNATAMEMLPLALDKLVPQFVAIIMSVTLILFVGEIFPAAVMTGPYQLQIVNFLTPFVYLIMVLFFPVSYPISRILDVCLGHDEGLSTYNRMELRTMVRIQHEFILKEQQVKAAKALKSKGNVYGAIMEDVETGNSGSMKMEINMIDAVLKFRDAVVKDAMTSEVFMLSMEDRFSYEV